MIQQEEIAGHLTHLYIYFYLCVYRGVRVCVHVCIRMCTRVTSPLLPCSLWDIPQVQSGFVTENWT